MASNSHIYIMNLSLPVHIPFPKSDSKIPPAPIITSASNSFTLDTPGHNYWLHEHIHVVVFQATEQNSLPSQPEQNSQA